MIKLRMKEKINGAEDQERIAFFEKYRAQMSVRDISDYLKLLKANRGTGKQVVFSPKGFTDAEIAEKWREHNLPEAERQRITATRNQEIRSYLDELAQKKRVAG